MADALLGPVGLPDLGTLFPATDDQYRGASSIELLREVAQRVHAERWWVVQRRRRDRGRGAAARARTSPRWRRTSTAALEPVRRPMGAGVHVSVKPKRGEGLGFVGRTEGIAAWAVALLELRLTAANGHAAREQPAE